MSAKIEELSSPRSASARGNQAWSPNTAVVITGELTPAVADCTTSGKDQLCLRHKARLSDD